MLNLLSSILIGVEAYVWALGDLLVRPVGSYSRYILRAHFFLPYIHQYVMFSCLAVQIFHQESGYYYNSKERYYYDKASGMYYGGDPPNWTNEPKMPNASLFGANTNMNTTKDDIGTVVKQIQKPKVYPSGMKVTHAHPLAGIGGYQMPTQGTIGGARGLDVLTKGNTSTASGKSKRSENGAKMSTDEEAFLARREAARKRVEKRTMDAFGMK